ncbi:LacI family DNA-binding transcriptional regulator [Bifidobacterium eulemuris]|uniref:LacI family DNA-binding transcriptional regulator n=1 Tax=Bifidobacterium eulemuris TaxID=1765219 RepID=A0A261GBM1_9BIFI|nr:LacI family DNA-binding transcriptional regulator [Bifidobacterium eulemuris]OZG68643.1 LacI family transcriptional regulator [Bifidobacterium eulemuris]QOL32759.1 LacI family DNA-binding transcriptional regulator [Bifidobacterium eulemuris]
MSATSPNQVSKRVQLSDIAAQTGVSLATVSKVLNGRADVSAKTRAKVTEALQSNGYTRRHAAIKQQRLIEVVFEDVETVWALEVLRGVLAEAKQHDLSVTVTEGGTKQHPDPSWLDGMLRRQPLGAILVFSNLSKTERTKLKARNIPFVVFDPSGDPSADSLSVQADNWTGGVIATRHLLSLGHTHIGIVTGPDYMMCSRARLDGYSSALAEKGISVDPALVTEGDFTTPSGYAQAMAMLENPDTRPTAIFAGNDLQAMGVYEAARQLGLRIPEDLSVVGFDDVQTAAFMGPALTTVRQPLQEMAGVATRMLIQATQGETPSSVILPTSLIVRNSTRALNG